MSKDNPRHIRCYVTIEWKTRQATSKKENNALGLRQNSCEQSLCYVGVSQEVPATEMQHTAEDSAATRHVTCRHGCQQSIDLPGSQKTAHLLSGETVCPLPMEGEGGGGPGGGE